MSDRDNKFTVTYTLVPGKLMSIKTLTENLQAIRATLIAIGKQRYPKETYDVFLAGAKMKRNEVAITLEILPVRHVAKKAVW